MTAAELDVERRGDHVVARLSGELDVTNAGWAADALGRSVPNDASGLVLDIGELRYLDSAGIALVFDVARRLRHRRQTMAVVLPDDSPLKRVVELTEVGSVAPVHASVESALDG